MCFFAGSLENRIEHFVKKHRLERTLSDDESGQQQSAKKEQIEVILSGEGSSQEHFTEYESSFKTGHAG